MVVVRTDLIEAATEIVLLRDASADVSHMDKTEDVVNAASDYLIAAFGQQFQDEE